METKKASSGDEIIDNSLNGGYESDSITTIYGPAGSGKTLLCILCSINLAKNNKKIIYIDTEGGFSVERLKQLTPDYKEILTKMVFLKPTTFEEQKKAFERLKEVVDDKVGIIIIDTIAMLYRLELGKSEDVYNVNRELGQQLSYLTEIARKKNIPILITNQVYANFDNKNKVNIVGGDLLKYGSKCLIELQSFSGGRRGLILRKHRSIAENKTALFRIVENGIEPVEGSKEMII